MAKGRAFGEILQDERQEAAARLESLYGKLLPDVQFLRSRGDSVLKENGRLTLNGREISDADLRRRAARERRLAASSASSGVRQVSVSASGLEVGAVAARPAPRVVSKEAQRVLVPAAGSAKPLSGAALKARQKAAEHSADLGTRPRVVWLDKALLDVDHTYQRAIGDGGSAHVNRIAKAFNWNCYQPIIVSERPDGRFAVIDGQHRLEAARKHPLIDSLPCYVIDAPDVAQQALVFVEVNTSRRALTSSQKFFASRLAGEPTAVALAEICEKAGVTILKGPTGGETPPMSILGPLAMQRFVSRYGARPVREAIQLLATTHRTTPGAFRSSIVGALTRIAADKGYVRDRLGAILRGVDIGDLLAAASREVRGSNGSLAVGCERVLRNRMAGKAE